MRRAKRPPSLDKLLTKAIGAGASRPVAFVVAGHNGSGKSTLWYNRLVPILRIPLINADRLTLSILPPEDPATRRLPSWAQKLRDDDVRWQLLSQEGVLAFISLVTEKRMSFAFETVFSHWKRLPNGRYESKADIIEKLRASGYFVVLLFVGLASVELSILRVETRKSMGGHDVPLDRLRARYPRTQQAIGNAAPLADMTLMFDNSRSLKKAFQLVRAQRGNKVLFDCRDPGYKVETGLKEVASHWLDKVVGPLRPARAAEKKS